MLDIKNKASLSINKFIDDAISSSPDLQDKLDNISPISFDLSVADIGPFYIKINKESLFWWELFSCVKGLAIWISAGHEFISGDNIDPINLFSAWIPGDIHTEIILNILEGELH